MFLNRNVTLLHYLITILEQKYPKVSLIHEDLHNVPEAAKVKYVTKSHYYTHLRVSVSPKRVYVIEKNVGTTLLKEYSGFSISLIDKTLWHDVD